MGFEMLGFDVVPGHPVYEGKANPELHAREVRGEKLVVRISS